MSGNELVKRSPACPEARLEYVTAYCFGDLGEAERQTFESHLMECDVCWADVRRLDQAVGVLRSEKSLGEPHRGYDMFVILGISSRLPLLFGGHLWHILTACALYAFLYAAALVLEVTYQLEHYRPSVWWLSAGVFTGVFVTSLAGLALDWKSMASQKATRLFYSIPFFVFASLLLYFALKLYLPEQPITEASIQAYPAQGAYLKNILYFLPLGLVFLALPYQFVLAMQRELREERHRLGLALLSGEKWGVAPKGVVYLRVSWLAVLLTGAFVVSLALTAHLFDNLLPGAHKSLFVQLVLLRTILYFGLGIKCLLWYSRTLNEMKRECLGVTAANLSNRQS